MTEILNGLFNLQGYRLLAVILCSFILIGVESAHSQPKGKYSAAEQIYLTNINPVLNDYSQTASKLNSLVVYLQSEPADQCAKGFGHYRDIFSSLKLQLIGFKPPSSLESVHRNSIEAITDYETGADLYGTACVEEDINMRNRLKMRAGEYFSASVKKIGEVYSELESPDAAAAQTAEASGAVTAEAGIEGGEVITEKKASEIEAPQVKATEAEQLQTVPSEITGAETISPQAPVTETRTPEPISPESAVPDDMPGITATGPAESAESAGNETRGAQEEVSKDERISKLNEIIMERGTAEKEISSADNPKSAVSETTGPEIAATETGLLADDIESWCVVRTGNEAERVRCVASQADAKSKIENLIESYPAGTRENEVVEKCKSDWKEGTAYNYEMVVSCVQFFCTRKGMESCKELTDQNR